MTELLNISPEYIRVAFWVCFFIGAMVLWRFRKYVLIIGSGAIAIYLLIKKSIAGEE